MKHKKTNGENADLKLVKKFHQFIKVEMGPVNTAIIDLLTGNVFQVPNEVINQFDAGNYDDVNEFIKVAYEEFLIIDISPSRWIPVPPPQAKEDNTKKRDKSIELHIDEGIPVKKIMDAFKGFSISKIYYYSEEIPEDLNNLQALERKEKNFEKCRQQANVDGNFYKTHSSMVKFNMQYNSCWGSSIAITADGKIRPCIHSQIEVGDIETDLEDIDALFEKMEPFWRYNKDRVQRCSVCEFRYVCFDCREIAFRKTGDMDGTNPLCNYNPYTGEWEEEA